MKLAERGCTEGREKIEPSNFKYNWKTDLWKIFSHPCPTLEKNGRFMRRVSCDLEGLAGLSGSGSGVCDGLSGPAGVPRVPGLWSMAKEGLGTLRLLGLGAHGGAAEDRLGPRESLGTTVHRLRTRQSRHAGPGADRMV